MSNLSYDERKKYACDVCGNVPDQDGLIEHGRGCYTQSENGGGTSLVKFAKSIPTPAELKADEDESIADEIVNKNYPIEGAMDRRLYDLHRHAKLLESKLAHHLATAGKVGYEKTLTLSGTVKFLRSDSKEKKECVCCPDSIQHIFCRYVDFGTGEIGAGGLNSLLNNFAADKGDEGKMVEVTIRVFAPPSRG